MLLQRAREVFDDAASLSVVLVALFAFVFLGERPLPKDWLGIALVCAGLVLLALKR